MYTEEILDLSYDCVLPSAIFFNENLEPACIKFYAVVRNLSKLRGYCFATNTYLSKLLKVDESTIKRWLRSLSEQGFIKIHTDKKGIHWERQIEIDDKFKKCLRRLKNELPPAQKCTPPSSKMSHIIEDKENEDKKKERERVEPSPPPPLFRKGSVEMQEAQHAQLVKEYGEAVIDDYIERLELYSKTSPQKFKKYQCHASVLRTWLKKDNMRRIPDKVVPIHEQNGAFSPAHPQKSETAENRNYYKNDQFLGNYRYLQMKGMMVYTNDRKVVFPALNETLSLEMSPGAFESKFLEIKPRLTA